MSASEHDRPTGHSAAPPSPAHDHASPAAEAADLAKILARAQHAGIDPQRVLCALGLSPLGHRESAGAGGADRHKPGHL